MAAGRRRVVLRMRHQHPAGTLAAQVRMHPHRIHEQPSPRHHAAQAADKPAVLIFEPQGEAAGVERHGPGMKLVDELAKPGPEIGWGIGIHRQPQSVWNVW